MAGVQVSERQVAFEGCQGSHSHDCGVSCCQKWKKATSQGEMTEMVCPELKLEAIFGYHALCRAHDAGIIRKHVKGLPLVSQGLRKICD
ncbi:hypothetical protein AA103581_0211 [Gluconobacter wancherniae NBRC 103581]|nr:hypothetical protein AA103581_0211 [Gluconobacter wancherniae NBRC 103581]